MTQRYKVIVQHDGGRVTVQVTAKNAQAAADAVKAAEGCPDGAIKGVQSVLD